MAWYVLYREEDFFPPKLPQIARCLIISINTELIKMKEVRGNVGLQNSFFFLKCFIHSFQNGQWWTHSIYFAEKERWEHYVQFYYKNYDK